MMRTEQKSHIGSPISNERLHKLGLKLIPIINKHMPPKRLSGYNYMILSFYLKPIHKSLLTCVQENGYILFVAIYT